jgi:hypothetical protein
MKEQWLRQVPVRLRVKWRLRRAVRNVFFSVVHALGVPVVNRRAAAITIDDDKVTVGESEVVMIPPGQRVRVAGWHIARGARLRRGEYGLVIDLAPRIVTRGTIELMGTPRQEETPGA